MSRILMPLAAGFRAGAALHRAAYRKGWLKKGRLKQPVVSVGNLSVGGTGKTPMVAFLAERLLARGWKPSILTRGYGRRGDEMIAIEPASKRSPDPRLIGDEPALLARRLPQVPIIVGANRFHAGSLAEKRFGVNAHILDDGFQHHTLERDLDIVLVDLTQTNSALLPAGRLREPFTALKRAQMVVLTRKDDRQVKETENRIHKLNPQAKVFYSSTKLKTLFDYTSGRQHEPEKTLGQPVLAFCGIGNPRAFFSDLRKWGFSLTGEVTFPDHHVYGAKELDRLIARASKSRAAALMTTEKDLMNLPTGWKSALPVRAALIETVLSDSKEFESAVIKTLEAAIRGA